MNRRTTSWLWLLPGLGCCALTVPSVFFWILIASDEAQAAKPFQLAAMGFALAGVVLLALGVAKVASAYLASRAPDS